MRNQVLALCMSMTILSGCASQTVILGLVSSNSLPPSQVGEIVRPSNAEQASRGKAIQGITYEDDPTLASIINLAQLCQRRRDAACRLGLIRASTVFWSEAPVSAISGPETITLGQQKKLKDAADSLKDMVKDDAVTDKVVVDVKGFTRDRIIEVLKVPSGVAKRFLDVVEIVAGGVDPGPVGENLELGLYHRDEQQLDSLEKRVEDATRILEVLGQNSPSQETKDACEKAVKGL